MDSEESIEKTRQGFEALFASDAYYNKQTRDERHLETILNCLSVKAGMRILDLGTGTGFLAFAFAERYPQAKVAGLDIVEQALEENRKRAESRGLSNIRFVCYNGMELPFADHSFDVVTTRYALHHFPEIQAAFSEISRVLKPDGLLFLSDPAPNDDDTERFVDAYMQMKKDGHIKFYTKGEWLKLGEQAGLHYKADFETEIRFPRKRATALGFDDIMSRFAEEVIRGYGVEVVGDEIWITEKVNNLIFQKQRD